MMDSELKKTSVRANKLEKKRFEMMMSAFDSAKKNVAVDMKKSQLDFKRRLKRYKDRQREISVTRSGPASNSIEEFIVRQMRRRSHLNHLQQLGPRPQTSPHIKGNLNSDSLRRAGTSNGIRDNANTSLGSSDFEDDEDFLKLSHCRRSKIDLRPCTAWSTAERTLSKADSTSVTQPAPGDGRLLNKRSVSLGTPARQIRYLNDEEISERSTFYRFLLDSYRNMEYEKLETLNDRVDEFCGKTVHKSVTCPPVVRLSVVSLPAGVPPIIHRALKVKVPPTPSPGLLQRSKTQ